MGLSSKTPKGQGTPNKSHSSMSSTRTPRRLLRKNRFREPHEVSKVSQLNILDEVGRGSFGKVVLAQLKKGPRDMYALKRLDRHKLQKMGILRQIEVEQKAQYKVGNHPYVVKLFSSWCSSDELFLLLEYADGGDMFDYIREHKRVQPQDAARYLYQLAQALDYIHAEGIIYRDMKIENVLIRREHNQVLLADFGLSKELEPGQTTKTICGTVQYMAPELLNNDQYSHTIDWWSLGVTVYILMSGNYPFAHGEGKLRNDCGPEDRLLIYTRISKGLVEYPEDIFPHDATEVIKQLLEPNVAHRLCSSKRLAATKWICAADTSAPPVTPMYKRTGTDPLGSRVDTTFDRKADTSASTASPKMPWKPVNDAVSAADAACIEDNSPPPKFDLPMDGVADKSTPDKARSRRRKFFKFLSKPFRRDHSKESQKAGDEEQDSEQRDGSGTVTKDSCAAVDAVLAAMAPNSINRKLDNQRSPDPLASITSPSINSSHTNTWATPSQNSPRVTWHGASGGNMNGNAASLSETPKSVARKSVLGKNAIPYESPFASNTYCDSIIDVPLSPAVREPYSRRTKHGFDRQSLAPTISPESALGLRGEVEESTI